jgi:FKBP-type peptidyl-prolyl cis-trans isomerase
MRLHLPFARNAALSLLVFFAAGCVQGTEVGTPSNPATETFASSLGIDLSKMTKISDDLYIQDVINGTGTVAASGKTLNVTYTGWLVDGTQFDSNVGKAAFSFPLGVQAVIGGWDLGLAGMHVGGTRLLVIGSNLAYGSSGSPPVIPGNATLVFKVQLLSVQ